LRYKNNKIIASFARIGFNEDGKWFLHKLRSDFVPSQKFKWKMIFRQPLLYPAKVEQSLILSTPIKVLKW
jgi:phosphoenolpyruvate carboxykinase (diphosphate)